MTNYFELYQLPVTFHPDPVEVKRKFYELSRLYHPDRFAQTGGEELATALRMAAMNNDAYKTLRNPDATMAYILKLNNLLEDEEKYNLPPAFLMEMMDINEAISDYEAMPDNEDAHQMAINSLNEQLELWEDATKILIEKFDNGDKSQDLLLQVKDQYFRKKYLLRIKERIDKLTVC
jgi:molecular chaperone HscB